MTYPNRARELLQSAVDKSKLVREAAKAASEQITKEREEASQRPQETEQPQ